MSAMSQQIVTIEDIIVNDLISAIQEVDVRLDQCELTDGAPIKKIAKK